MSCRGKECGPVHVYSVAEKAKIEKNRIPMYRSWESRSWLVPSGLKGQNKHQNVCTLGVERRVGYKKANFSTTEEVCF